MKSFKTFRLHQELYFSSFGQNSKSAIILEQKKSYSIRTVDNLGYDDKLDKCTNFLNPLSGPFSLKGAKHGDVITLNIEKITHTRDIGLSSCGPLPSYLLGTLKKNVVGEPVIFWKIEDDFCYPIVDNQIDRSIALKKALMIGCLRSADDLGKATISSLDADQYGGNFDCNLFKQGALIFLPIRNDNAEFYIGDVHYCQSDGEIGGSMPDARAAARIIECLDDLLPAVHLDPEPLLAEAQRIEGEIREMMAVHLNPPSESGDAPGSMYG